MFLNQSAAYNLPELPVPANTPGWLIPTVKLNQRRLDDEYTHGPGGLDNFFAQSQSYIDTQVITRANSKDPANYSVPPFAMAIPRRQIVTLSDDGLTTSQKYLDADPNIHMPQVPGWVPPVDKPLDPLFNGTHPPEAGVSAATMGQLMAVLMGRFDALEAKLDQLLKAKG